MDPHRGLSGPSFAAKGNTPATVQPARISSLFLLLLIKRIPLNKISKNLQLPLPHLLNCFYISFSFHLVQPRPACLAMFPLPICNHCCVTNPHPKHKQIGKINTLSKNQGHYPPKYHHFNFPGYSDVPGGPDQEIPTPVHHIQTLLPCPFSRQPPHLIRHLQSSTSPIHHKHKAWTLVYPG